MNQELKKVKQNNGLVEAGYVGLFSIIDRYMHPLIEQGGIFTLALMPVFEFVRAGLYWQRSSDEGFKDGMQKIWLNRAYYVAKAMVTSIGVGLALSGMMLQGFGVVIAGAYAGTLRYLGKTAQYALKRNVDKTASNLTKVIIGGMIAGGFTLIAFYPELSFIGWSMVLAATSTAVLSGTPKLIAGLVKKPEVLDANVAPEEVKLMGAEHNAYVEPGLDKSPVRFRQGIEQRKSGNIAKLKTE